MPQLSEAELEDETSGSVADLVADGLPSPRFFAYPYGARNAAAISAARRAGFLAAFGPEQDKLERGSHPFDLPRVLILAEDSGWRFRLKIMSPPLRTFVARVQNGLERRFAKVTGGSHARA
jgi:peptidoglycan/xylan/chitin deacetylase (PgdA/CDA1 family)